MTNSWPPPQGAPNPNSWPAPQGSPHPAPNLNPGPSSWPAPAPAAPDWQQQWPAPAAPAWQQQQQWPPQKTGSDTLLEWSIPINRSGLAIAAGYVALLTLPILIAAPVGLLLGILALRDIRNNPHKLGKGRAWFAIIYGGIGTALLLYFLVAFVANLAAR